MKATPEQILRYANTIAVVGASKDPNKAAGSVPMVMKKHGFKVIPVNPTAAEIMGERAYPSLAEVPEKIDVVQVFRPSAEAADIACQAVAVGARALWLQQGIRSDEARRIAEAGGLDYVEDSCMSVERALHRVDKRPH